LTVTRHSGKQRSWKRFHRINFQSPWEEQGWESKSSNPVQRQTCVRCAIWILKLLFKLIIIMEFDLFSKIISNKCVLIFVLSWHFSVSLRFLKWLFLKGHLLPSFKAQFQNPLNLSNQSNYLHQSKALYLLQQKLTSLLAFYRFQSFTGIYLMQKEPFRAH